MAIAIDTDKAIQALMGVGFKQEQARTIIDVVTPLSADLATKDFIRSQMAELESRLTAKIYGGQIACVAGVIGSLKLFGVI